MSIETRIKQLEKSQAGGGRCYNCRDWRAAYFDGGEPPTPGRCPVCGFTPARIVVKYVDNWRDGYAGDAPTGGGPSKS